jgi:hypothetical protein
MIIENQAGAYIAPKPELFLRYRLKETNPHFDVLENARSRLILAKCSRLPDDEDPAAGRYGIDCHRALPPFAGESGFSCDWGDGPIPVNALNFARFLPRTIRFRQFTANLAFAAHTREAYEAKCQVYQDFYRHVYNARQPLVITTPHSGPVHRSPDDYHPFPESEIDAWTAGVAVRLEPVPAIKENRRLLLSLHSTDYFGALVDFGDFGLANNHILPQIISELNTEFSEILTALQLSYRRHIVSYCLRRLEWKHTRWGTLHPEQLSNISTASRFEIMMLDKLTGEFMRPEERFTLDGFRRGLEAYWATGAKTHITLNNVFSGRKTAKLLNLSENLAEAGFHSAVQVECSRFLARYYPETAAAIIGRLLAMLSERVP